MAKQISTAVTIHQTPDKVWDVLTRMDLYPEWNPFITSLQGSLQLGGTLTVTIQPPGSKDMTFRPRVVRLDECKLLRWKGKLLVPGLFDGEHSFELEDNRDGTTTLRHGERFTGILVGLFNLTKTEQGFEAMNQKLKERVEGGAHPASPQKR